MTNFDAQTDEPAIRRARDDSGFDVSDEPDGLAHLDPANDGQLDTLPINLDRVRMRFIRSWIGAETIACNSFLLELWVFGAAFEEILEGCAKVLDGLLGCVLGYFQHPRESVVFDRIERAAHGHL